MKPTPQEEHEADAWIVDIATADGGLYDPGNYTSWSGDREIVLDGRFTLAMLKNLVEFMEEH